MWPIVAHFSDTPRKRDKYRCKSVCNQIENRSNYSAIRINHVAIAAATAAVQQHNGIHS